MGQKRILLVEDDLSVLKMTKVRLEHEGYAVITATDGEEAVRQATEGPSVDLILLDLKLPKLDGFEVCRQLKATPSTAEIPVIIFTASSVSWQHLADECVKLGVADWLRKPFRSKELLEKVQQAMRGEGSAHG